MTWCGLVYPIHDEIWYIQYQWREVEWAGRGRDTDEKHGKDCVWEGFHLARVKLDRVVEDNNESIGVECLLLFEMKNWSLRAREYGMYNTFIGYGV